MPPPCVTKIPGCHRRLCCSWDSSSSQNRLLMFSRCESPCAACGRRAGTHGWNAGRGTDWQFWALASRAGSEEHVDCDISSTQGLSLREPVCLQRWSFLPAQCGRIHLGHYLRVVLLYGSVMFWPRSLSWFRSIWTPGVLQEQFKL